ncbi:opsin-VA [Nematostella vectensis]|uniref:opsin-VA n=1 Tax=Nematostella vectensis TaxID=45351 RepID=UPI002076EF49|nr:opsin-VA [Nematostella vectensis]
MADEHQDVGTAYWVTMTVILTLGVIVNIAALWICFRPENRKKEITPLIANIAVADLILITCGHTSTHLRGAALQRNEPPCMWIAILNGIVGIVTIVTMASINILLLRKMQSVVMVNLPACRMAALIACIWGYSISVMSTPLLGWGSFYPGKSSANCEPEWTSRGLGDISYNVTLLVTAFVFPMAVIIYTFYRIKRRLRNEIPTAFPQGRRRMYTTLSRMMVGVTVAFTLSWSPYAILSVISMVTGRPIIHVVPSLMAKSSVMYTPIVYIAFSRSFRSAVNALYSLLTRTKMRPIVIKSPAVIYRVREAKIEYVSHVSNPLVLPAHASRD